MLSMAAAARTPSVTPLPGAIACHNSNAARPMRHNEPTPKTAAIASVDDGENGDDELHRAGYGLDPFIDDSSGPVDGRPAAGRLVDRKGGCTPTWRVRHWDVTIEVNTPAGPRTTSEVIKTPGETAQLSCIGEWP